MNRDSLARTMAEGMMSKRKKKLDTMTVASNKKHMGGMMDIIYRKKKEREKAIADIDY